MYLRFTTPFLLEVAKSLIGKEQVEKILPNSISSFK